VRCEPNLRFLRSSFKHIGDSQFFEVVTTSEESMQFDDHGVVLCRFLGGCNNSSRIRALHDVLVD
jgi:hypothetical protein